MATVVVTGANRGIGLEFVKQYLAKGDKVIALCRNTSDELSQSDAKVIDKVDVSSPECLEKILPTLSDLKIDLLINNAGVFANETLEHMSVKTLEYQFRVNAIGPLMVTQMLRQQLVKGAKVAMITSRMGSVTDNTSGGYYGYRMSKAALNIAGVSLAHDLKEQEVAVALLHPGHVQTEMVNYSGDISAAVAVERLIQRIEELNLGNTGTFWHSNGEVLPW
ncbi:SDR family oxidoreductase [Paraglaciecola psychrophila]|jgi:NAD(P)-dependent dehydrogenase (short-subunit alcohol dehydrogenase family)|uniref:Short-chain dehydrogenase/reductase SDR n=1 Tax=Paraglaciecola psychrophila 170 TaxID=1129794 RepID=K7AFR3_9ALTE|nr:SDR family oxidoreductase [Paraglaciecola psychrophila]AGH45292.1 short-chain dehydrogenase/reductase SDR [Paraglaciecola psychrophila 170]GAC39478.1 C-factor [Paraglaciecola psychrophila 170]